jgi:hypothetical protein
MKVLQTWQAPFSDVHPPEGHMSNDREVQDVDPFPFQGMKRSVHEHHRESGVIVRVEGALIHEEIRIALRNAGI